MFELLKLCSLQWSNFSESAHKLVFGKLRTGDMERVTGAFLAVDRERDQPFGYATFQERDKDFVHLQYGGILPEFRGSAVTFRLYERVIEDLKKTYSNISTSIESENTAMLRMAMAEGFRIVGTKALGDRLLVELFLKGEK